MSELKHDVLLVLILIKPGTAKLYTFEVCKEFRE